MLRKLVLSKVVLVSHAHIMSAEIVVGLVIIDRLIHHASWRWTPPRLTISYSVYFWHSICFNLDRLGSSWRDFQGLFALVKGDLKVIISWFHLHINSLLEQISLHSLQKLCFLLVCNERITSLSLLLFYLKYFNVADIFLFTISHYAEHTYIKVTQKASELNCL